ncbi:MAG: hypothetical protein ACW986_00795 [Promethearchaeota archaeon]|jgi:hypothetical protein
MGKDKKGLGIKTTRYFTKNCSACGFEYPNWFTNCPKCGSAWDEQQAKAFQPSPESQKKTIKIVVKITEEDFNRAILSVNLIFSANQGKSWYQMQMDSKVDYFIAEIAEVPAGSNIIYYIEVYLDNGEIVIENNNNKYYYYKVGVSLGEPEETPSELERRSIKDNIKESDIKPEQYLADSQPPKKIPHISRKVPNQILKKPQSVIQPKKEENVYQTTSSKDSTIFGKPQTNIDPELKVCSFCNSKIKKMWSTCPICGENI